jgi:hypothetical protein
MKPIGFDILWLKAKGDMSGVTLAIQEEQVVQLVQQLSPAGKRAVLRMLLPESDLFEYLLEYGRERVYTVADIEMLTGKSYPKMNENNSLIRCYTRHKHGSTRCLGYKRCHFWSMVTA